MDSRKIQELVTLAASRRGQPVGERILALAPEEQLLLSHMAILTEYISPEDMSLFFRMCGFDLSDEKVMSFAESGLSCYALLANTIDGQPVALFRVE